MTRKPGSDKTQVVTNSGSMLTWALATLDFRFDETVENIIHLTLVPGTHKNIIEIAFVNPTAHPVLSKLMQLALESLDPKG